MSIQRHNEAVRISHKAIIRSSMIGGCYCAMDACPADRMPQGVDNTRPPAWLLPADHPYLPELTALRPDLLMIEGITSNEVKGLNNDAIRALILQRGRNVRIHILEIGYCSDLRHGERNDEKQQQHDRLIRILTGQPIEPRSPKNLWGRHTDR